MNKTKNILAILSKLWPWFLLAVVVCLWGYGRFLGELSLGVKAGINLKEFQVEMALILPPMFLLVGLFEVWVPRKLVERHVGRHSGVYAILWMVILATVQAGPLYAAFPVAVGLWQKGCAPRNVFVYLGAFSAIKIPMLSFEVAFLGWRFSLARTIITLPVFIVISFVMEKFLPKDFVLPETGLDIDKKENANKTQ